MKNVIKTIACLALLVILAGSCRKKAFDEFYGRPDSLAQPIYQQLQARSNFTSLLACIDKAGYKDILSAAGSWTLFAANDDAFRTFFTERNITGIAQIDSGTAQQIVTYALVFNAFAKARLGDYQSATGWVTNIAYKRRTAYYRGFYNDTSFAGQKVKALGSNRNGNFIFGDNNNKYIPYFVDNFLAANALTVADYNYFYPNSIYKGFNVAGAGVVTADLFAENGYIHEIDKVLLPLPSVDQYLASNPQYSEFKKLFDKYMVNFVLNNDATNRYKILTGLSENVFIKTFNSSLGFSPNNENFIKQQDNDGQANGYTMFVPRNSELLSYINNVLLENYISLDQMPLQIIVDFINAHMWQTTVWPSKFATSNNVQGEPARFDAATNVIDKQVLSNGIFYGTNKVQQANVFSTVYGRPYLDPKYLLMTRALDLNFRYLITIPTIRYTVFMMTDQLLRAKGFDYNVLQSAWQYTVPGTTTVTIGNTARDMLQRILATHIAPTPNGELDNLSGAGIVETVNGEYIKFNAGILSSAGTTETGSPVKAPAFKTSTNGRVYYSDSLLTYSSTTIGNAIKKLGSPTASQFNSFYQFLSNSPIFNTTTGDILGVQVGTFYTVFIPNNAAIQAAVNAGLLPGTGAGTNKTPVYNPTVQADKDLVANFILYHILNKTTVVPDGKKTGTYESLYKKLSGDAAQFAIASSINTIQITDNYGRKANVIIGSSNNLADRCVIHLIDNYLQYNPN